MTSKELVYATLSGKNAERVPRQLWTLPWAAQRFERQIKKTLDDFPEDIVSVNFVNKKSPAAMGNPYDVGESRDDWGCKFFNIQKGVHGEVKEPIVKDGDWADSDNINVPEEWLDFSIDEINLRIKKDCSDKFVLCSNVPRPFERLQFIRGTENLFVDLMLRPKRMMKFIEKMHNFYCRFLNKVVKTDIDAIFFMDDWGSQTSLLIDPKLWEEIFMPLYKEYIDIAHRNGKKAFMHSDGYTLSIIPKLIDIGLDALNTQIFCMGFDKLKQFKGKITFWGEIDRQNLLPNATMKEIDHAVSDVYKNLWSDGYCIAQCEFGPAAKPENVYRLYDAWNKQIIK